MILHDALRIEPGADDAYVALAPGHRAVGTLVATNGDQGAFSRHEALEAGGYLRRVSAASAADVRLR